MRIFGMMPSKDVEICKSYKDQNGLSVYIESGKTGYSVIWADGSVSWEDNNKSAQDNFNDAYNLVTEKGFILTESTHSEHEVSEEC